MQLKLNNSMLKTLEPKEKYYRVWDNAQPGLFVRVTPTGRKVFALRYISQAGKDRSYTIGRFGQITLEQARTLARQHLGAVAQGVDVHVAKGEAKRAQRAKAASTLGALIESHYRDYLETHRKSGTVLLAELKTHFGDYYEKQLTDLDIRLLTHWRNKRLKSGIAPASVNRNISTLKAALNRAVEWKLIESNPLANLKPLKLDKLGKVRYLEPAEETALRSALKKRDAEISEKRSSANQWRQRRNYSTLPEILPETFGDHLTPIVFLALNTGMRRGELLKLKWENTDLELRLITVVGDTAKSGQTRHIPLNDEAFDTLTKWRKQTSNKDLVFPSPLKKGPLNSIKKAWTAVLSDAGISNFRFHDCRHHFASKLVMKRVDLNTVRELLGHSSIEMTLRYAHLAPQHKAAALQLLCN